MTTPLVSRADWGARPPRSVTRRDLVEDTAHYGGPSPWGASADRSSPARFAATTDHQRCASIVRAYQAYHMDAKGWQDIAYSSLVCPHGWRYEGRGRDVRTAANGTTAGNDASHATCYLAGDGDPLTDEAKAAFADESVRLDVLDKGHRDWKPTACPGDPLYGWVHGGQPTPAGAPQHVDTHDIDQEDDTVAYKVIRHDPALDPAGTDHSRDRSRWLALGPNGPVHVPTVEYHDVGVDLGILQPVEPVSARRYDVAADLARRFDIDGNEIDRTLAWYAGAFDPANPGTASHLHRIVGQVLDARAAVPPG